MHEFLKLPFLGRILGIIRQISRTHNQMTFCLAFVIIYQNCYKRIPAASM
jgi:hypothetical protein